MTIKGKTCIIDNKPPADSIVQAKPASIFNKQCPLIIFANRRNAKLTTRKEYETISIGINNGASASGAPAGKKNEKP